MPPCAEQVNAIRHPEPLRQGGERRTLRPLANNKQDGARELRYCADHVMMRFPLDQMSNREHNWPREPQFSAQPVAVDRRHEGGEIDAIAQYRHLPCLGT
jgi:hypothetical protein